MAGVFRIVIIALASFCAIVPSLALFHRFLALNDSLAWWFSIIFAWLILPSILFSLWKEKVDPSIIPIDPDDPVMLSHIALARENIDRLYSALDEGKLEVFVKFPYLFEQVKEHLWAVAHQRKGESIIVTLESEPVSEIPQEMCQRMTIDTDQIEDWMLVNSKGQIQGGYTVLAQAKIYQRDFGKLPKKYEDHLKTYTDFSWP